MLLRLWPYNPCHELLPPREVGTRWTTFSRLCHKGMNLLLALSPFTLPSFQWASHQANHPLIPNKRNPIFFPVSLLWHWQSRFARLCFIFFVLMAYLKWWKSYIAFLLVLGRDAHRLLREKKMNKQQTIIRCDKCCADMHKMHKMECTQSNDSTWENMLDILLRPPEIYSSSCPPCSVHFEVAADVYGLHNRLFLIPHLCLGLPSVGEPARGMAREVKR